MATIIDIIGSSGVGKTTFVNSLCCCSLSNQKKSIIVRDVQALRRLRPWVPDPARKLVQQWNLKTRPTSLLFRFLWLFYTMPETEEYWDAITQGNVENVQFLEFVLSLIQQRTRPVEYRMKGVQFFLNTYEQRMVLEKSLMTNLVVLDDEPLSYRPSLFSIDGDQEKLVEKYYALLPLPTALIFVDASTECILKRIQKRANNGGEYAIRHQGKNTRELINDIDNSRKFAKTASLTLVARGVPIIQIDAEDSIRKNQRKALEFIDTLNI
ncbi:hypothetical protein GKODMF_10815 [Candidatus Electrothrix gigas]